MSQEEITVSTEKKTDAPPERLVRHAFWKYPLIAMVLLVLVALLAGFVGSPNWPRDTIAGVTKADPGGAILAFTQELDGTSSSAGNAQEYGMGNPSQVFVLNPLRQAASLLGADVQQAIATYDAASPDFKKLDTLKGDFGPVPTLVKADLQLAQNGYLEQYLQAIEPGHAYHLSNIWLYDHPNMLNTAVNEGLTDDQWGMVKERGFPVGPWYLIIPAIIHVKLPGGEGGPGFVLWNLLFAFFLLFLVPLVPGLRDLPRYLKFYRFIYRYPLQGELEKPLFRERHGPVHGGHGDIEVAGGGK